MIIPDFGFYAPDFHASLIRQGRLAIGVIALAELDKMQQMVLLINDKIGRHCTFDDAETFARQRARARYDAHSTFVQSMMRA